VENTDKEFQEKKGKMIETIRRKRRSDFTLEGKLK
jgi:hypothetical protein